MVCHQQAGGLVTKEREEYFYKNIRQYCKAETDGILYPVFNIAEGDEDPEETPASVEDSDESNQPGLSGIQNQLGLLRSANDQFNIEV